MPAFSPNPNNRLYTNRNNYLEFLGYVLGQRSRHDTEDIEKFEKALCERFGVGHAICVYQCRVGIYLAVKALIKPGQEVILSPYTVADVINMVIFAGGRPVFADLDRETCNMSSSDVERLIGPETGAVLITHLHGLAADAHDIKEICDRFEVPMIEDCAQAFGVEERGKPVGTIGDVGVFSFEMHKNISTWLGGGVVSDRKDIIDSCRAALKDFTRSPLPGLRRKVKAGVINDVARAPVIFQMLTYPVLRYGYLKKIDAIKNKSLRKPQESAPATELPDVYKSRYTSFQARIAMSQLGNVDSDIQTRIENGLLYYEGLKDIDQLILPPVQSERSNTLLSNTFLWFPIQYSEREDLMKFMFEKGRDVAAGHFFNCADAPRYKEFQRDCPNTRKIEKELLYLPTYPGYSRREVERNIEVIREYFRKRGKKGPARKCLERVDA